jgi:hypothetical protein
MIPGARLFPKLSNEYLFAKNGFLSLLEFKFKISTELNSKIGWEIIKHLTDQILNELGHFRRIPERAGPTR